MTSPTAKGKKVSLNLGPGAPPVPVMYLKESKGGTTLVPLPGLAPPGLHLELHPGEIHLKARDTGVLARLKTESLLRAVQDGTLDREFARALTPPRWRRSSTAVIMPAEFTHKLSGLADGGEIPLDRLLRAYVPVKFGDYRHLATELDRLRQTGVLRPRDFVLFESSCGFINLSGEVPKDFPEFAVPHNLPMWRTIEAGLKHICRYGGLFVRIPEGRALDAAARRVGLEGLTEGFAQLERVAKESGWESAAAPRIKELERALRRSLEGLSPRRELRVKSLRRLS